MKDSAAGITAIKKTAQARLGLTETPPQRMTTDQLDTIAEAFNDFEVAEAIGIEMLEMIVRDMVDWRERGLDFGKVAFNASALSK